MKIPQITRKARELEAKVLTDGYQATERDVAEARELVNQYIDELERLENTATPYRGADIEAIADKIIKRWYPDGNNN